MYLKNYQVKVISTLKRFFQKAGETKEAIEQVSKSLPENMRQTINWVDSTFESLNIPYNDKPRNGLGKHYPRFCLKVPTGGGKTLLAVESIREYQNLFAQRKTGLVVWIVPSETIYSQTVNKLRDKSNPLRQLLDQCSGGNTVILEKGQRLTTQDIEENLVVLFIMIQSVSRTNAKEALRVFRDSGGFESFFPSDNRYDLHKQLMKQVPNLDVITGTESAFPQITTSLGNAIRVSRPFIIIDEIHKVFSPMAKQTINNLNPEMVLGLSATPKANMNILITITGLELKDEEMVKLDLHLLPPAGKLENDWKSMLREIKAHREKLEEKAMKLKQNKGLYIRPITLIQVERTGKEQRTGKFVHSLDVKDYLIELGINPDEVAIKTSSQNDIEDVNLFDGDCHVRYIITKEALREGWDCSFAYILGIIPNVNSNTSVTQLVGRILRQPHARKTGIKELDESYAYYVKGDTRQMLERVTVGFRQEGLEDLVSKVHISDNGTDTTTKPVKIKKKYKDKYAHTFYLPVWLMITNNKVRRRFNYVLDIKPYLNFTLFNLNEKLLSKIENMLSEETKERTAFVITLDDKSKTAYEIETQVIEKINGINYGYITRRYTEIIENAFLARNFVNNHLEKLEQKVGREKLQEHFSAIVARLVRELKEERTQQEADIFRKHLESGKLILAISDDRDTGFKIPESDTIAISPIPNTYKYYLFDDVDITAMNSLEKKVGDILDKQEKIVWWFRNKVSKGWYSIQAWKQNKIRPDFVAAKKKNNDKIELVYILESKGEHLIGNPDTQYKKSVLDLMTDQNKQKKIKKYPIQIKIQFSELNDKAEFYIVESGKEEEELKRLMK